MITECLLRDTLKKVESVDRDYDNFVEQFTTTKRRGLFKRSARMLSRADLEKMESLKRRQEIAREQYLQLFSEWSSAVAVK